MRIHYLTRRLVKDEKSFLHIGSLLQLEGPLQGLWQDSFIRCSLGLYNVTWHVYMDALTNAFGTMLGSASVENFRENAQGVSQAPVGS